MKHDDDEKKKKHGLIQPKCDGSGRKLFLTFNFLFGRLGSSSRVHGLPIHFVRFFFIFFLSLMVKVEKQLKMIWRRHVDI